MGEATEGRRVGSEGVEKMIERRGGSVEGGGRGDIESRRDKRRSRDRRRGLG